MFTLTDQKPPSKGRAVPQGRLSRLVHMGNLAGGVVGSMLAGSARQVARGKRPVLADLLFTPGNAVRVTRELSHLRGAAMKVGQLMSMDAGDILPPELAQILAQLRADAEPMPERQLEGVLARAWGAKWRDRFLLFSARPIASASIGQVHRARTKDGRDLAIKVQYPGVKASIDSDVSNIATLIRLSGLLPNGLDVSPLLEEARQQLHEEADYGREADCLARFGALLADDRDFVVPGVHPDLTTQTVLAMSFVSGLSIDTLGHRPQEERDRVARLMIDLTLREVFDFGLMQSDPNFANYRYNATTGQLVLLDFGATRGISRAFADRCRRMLIAGVEGGRSAQVAAAVSLGLIESDAPKPFLDAVMDTIDLAIAPLRHDGLHDFGASDLVRRLRARGVELASMRYAAHVPPADLLFLERKVGGVYLLAARLGARVNLRELIDRHLEAPLSANAQSSSRSIGLD